MEKNTSGYIRILAVLAVLTVSCQKEPSITGIDAVIDGYEVTFSAVVENADTYLWDFGDSKTSTEAAPVHEYSASGTYTVNLTVTGKGGESQASKAIVIEPSVTELLSGGASAPKGKTWVLSNGYIEGINGGGAIENSMSIILPSMDSMLNIIGLDDEYDNEFTFYADGRYKADVKNGIALISAIYGQVTGSIVNVGSPANTLGIYGGTYTAPASATWTLHDEDLVVDAILNPLGTEVPALHGNVTLTGKKWVTLSEGAFFGILDFPTTRKFVIREITADKLTVALFICAYFADESAWTIPEYLFHVTYVPKK